MSVSLLSSVLLACGLGFTSMNPELPKTPSTHTLTIKVHEGGSLQIDGVTVGDTILQLRNANVATLAQEGNTLYTVTQPNGETFYKGDFTLAVQSISTGTVKIELEGGEATLSKAENTER